MERRRGLGYPVSRKEHGYPILTMASRTAPYRTVLAPPPEFGIDWRRIGAILARVATSPAEPASKNLVGVGYVDSADDGYTVCYRSRILGSEEVHPGPAEDRFSRHIRVREGVIFAGQRSVDPRMALAVAQRHLSEAIKDFWADSTRFEVPRVSHAVECAVDEAVPVGSPMGPDATAASAEEAAIANDLVTVSPPDQIVLRDAPVNSSVRRSTEQRKTSRWLIVLILIVLLMVVMATVLLTVAIIFR